MPYIGTQPNDVKKNTGLYTPSEILQLEKDGSWGGSLELIEEQTVSSVSQVDFTDLKNYDVHYVSVSNFAVVTTDNTLGMRFSNDNGTTFETSNYQQAIQQGESNGQVFESKTTSGTGLTATCVTGDESYKSGNSYLYLYNLLNSSKYSFETMHSISVRESANFEYRFGGGAYTVAETINAIRFYSASTFSANIKLFGVKQ